MFQM